MLKTSQDLHKFFSGLLCLSVLTQKVEFEQLCVVAELTSVACDIKFPIKGSLFVCSTVHVYSTVCTVQCV